MGYSDEVECPNNPSLGFFIDCSNNIYSCALLENYGNDTCDEGTNCNNNNTNCTNFNCLAWGFDGAECHDDNGNSWQGQIGSDYYCIGGIENIQNGDCDDCSGVPNGDSYLDNCGECLSDSQIGCIQEEKVKLLLLILGMPEQLSGVFLLLHRCGTFQKHLKLNHLMISVTKNMEKMKMVEH